MQTFSQSAEQSGKDGSFSASVVVFGPLDFIPFALQLMNDVEFRCKLIEETYLKRGLKAAYFISEEKL